MLHINGKLPTMWQEETITSTVYSFQYVASMVPPWILVYEFFLPFYHSAFVNFEHLQK